MKRTYFRKKDVYKLIHLCTLGMVKVKAGHYNEIENIFTEMMNILNENNIFKMNDIIKELTETVSSMENFNNNQEHLDNKTNY